MVTISLPSIDTVPAAVLAIVVSDACPSSMLVVTFKLPATVVKELEPLAIVTSISSSASPSSIVIPVCSSPS